jgi:hypothetical protein
VRSLPGVTPKRVDTDNMTAMATALSGHDVVVSSVHFTASDLIKLIAAVAKSGERDATWSSAAPGASKWLQV